MARHNFFEFHDDFLGNQVFSATAADNARWLIADTSAAGAPTYALVSPSASGEVALAFDATSEIQNVCLYQNDVLGFDITKIIEVEWRVKLNQALNNAATSLTFGICGARNNAIASMGTPSAFFKLAGASSVVNVATKDGTNSSGDIATAATLVAAYKRFGISFAAGLADVRFFVDGIPVATGTTFNMSAAAAGTSVQLLLQLQKTAATPVDGVTIDYVTVNGRRLAA